MDSLDWMFLSPGLSELFCYLVGSGDLMNLLGRSDLDNLGISYWSLCFLVDSYRCFTCLPGY